NVHVVPYLLGDKDGGGVLRVAAEPEASSPRTAVALHSTLYEERIFTGELDGAIVPNVHYDAGPSPVVGEQAIEVRALDGLLARGELPARAAPDLLCIDGPGTEF